MRNSLTSLQDEKPLRLDSEDISDDREVDLQVEKIDSSPQRVPDNLSLALESVEINEEGMSEAKKSKYESQKHMEDKSSDQDTPARNSEPKVFKHAKMIAS